MNGEMREIAGLRCLIAGADGAVVHDADGVRALIEEAMGERAGMIVIPVERLDPAFFQLRSGVAGDVLQKMMNYKFKVAVVGDISAHVTTSDALRDFVIESNRGRDIFFLPDLAALADRLNTLAASSN